MGARGRTAALLGVVLTAGSMPPVSAVAPEASDPVRVAIVGDSLAHGSSGDWTWRYFLHRHLIGGGTAVDLVGSRSDVFDQEGDDHDDTTTPRGSDAYVDPAFDRDHASRWSMALTLAPRAVPAVMATHAPDVVVLALGFNDLAWWGATPEQLVGMVHDQVEAARAVNPSVHVVLSEVMVDADYWRHLPVEHYNRLLRDIAPTWSTGESRVAVATVPDGYRADGPERHRDTWDGVHPDTSGQVKIAGQVAQALADVGVGSGPDPGLRLPAEGLRSGSVLAAPQPARRPTVVRLTWRGPPGATGHDVWMRQGNQTWRQVAWGVPSGHRVTGLTPGSSYRFKVVARKYAVRSAADQFSAPVRLTVLDRVQGATSTVVRRRVRMGWRGVPGATHYRVERRTANAWRPVRAEVGRTTVRFRLPRGRHVLRVRAMHGEWSARPSRRVRVRVR